MTEPRAADGDLALVIGQDGKRFILRLSADAELQTHRGVIAHNDLIGAEWGATRHSHLGLPYVLLQPSLDEILLVRYGEGSGILQPINPDNTSIFKRGQAVPVKFKLPGDEYTGFLTTGWTIMATPIRTQRSLEVGTPAPLTLTFVQNWTALLDR